MQIIKTRLLTCYKHPQLPRLTSLAWSSMTTNDWRMFDLKVFLNARWSDRLWNDGDVELYEPAKYDLSYSLSMTSRYRLETFMV